MSPHSPWFYRNLLQSKNQFHLQIFCALKSEYIWSILLFLLSEIAWFLESSWHLLTSILPETKKEFKKMPKNISWHVALLYYFPQRCSLLLTSHSPCKVGSIPCRGEVLDPQQHLSNIIGWNIISIKPCWIWTIGRCTNCSIAHSCQGLFSPKDSRDSPIAQKQKKIRSILRNQFFFTR